jgi:predicted extracellular nuclease
MTRPSARILALVASVAPSIAGCADDGAPGVTGDTIATTDGATPDDDASADASPDDAESPEDAVEADADDATASTDDTADAGPDTSTPPVDPIPPVDVAPDPGNCSPVGGDVNVFDLQDPACPDHISPEPEGTPGVAVELKGLVITANFGDTFFAQDPRGGPYSGITIFAHGDYKDETKPGQLVDITGNYSEFFENTQVYLETLTVRDEIDVPLPYEALHPLHLATNGPLAEMMESVLVRVVNVATTHTKPDCPFEFGEFEVGGGLRIDDMAYRWDARLGDQFTSITGPLNFSFGNHKIEPRGAEDVVVASAGLSTGLSKCIPNECQAPADATGTRAVIINEIMADPMGSDVNQEWIELYNPGSAPVDVAGWQLRDCATQAWTLRGTGLSIPAGGFLVVGMANNPTVNGGADVDLAYGNSAFYMPNTVGAVLLYDGAGLTANLVDQTRYSRFEDWASVFRSGASMERRGPTSNGTIPDGWARATREYGTAGNEGTPGARNSAR